MSTKKICLITCYKQPDYIRAKTLRSAFGAIDTVELLVIKNTKTGIRRYPEVLWKLLVMRLRHRPDAYMLTFRGYEMLPLVRLLTIGKPLIFDEFINFVEWVVYEHHKLRVGSLLAKLFQAGYKLLLQSTRLITTDTPSHARYSAELMGLPLDKYVPLTVSTDEDTFQGTTESTKTDDAPFAVFYYGNMLPLHGLGFVVEAAKELKDKNILFSLIGGNDKTAAMVEEAKTVGARIDYKSWVDFDKLPDFMQKADVCLGGPFGDTLQAQFVITGKTYQFLQMKRPTIIGKNQESHIFTDKKNALIVEQGSAAALRDTITWAYENRDKLPLVGENGYELYQEKLSNKVLVKQLQQLLSRL